MAVEQAAGPAKGRTLVRNIGLLLSGDLALPILEADALLIEDDAVVVVNLVLVASVEAGDVDAIPAVVHVHSIFVKQLRGRE